MTEMYIGFMKKLLDIVKRFWRRTLFRHVVYWGCVFLFFYVLMRPFEDEGFSLRFSAFIVAAGPIPVYLHFYVLRRYFERRKYWAYVLSTLVIFAGSSFLVEFIFRLFEKDPASHTSGLGMVIGYVVLSTGLRYYSRGVRQQVRLQEAEFKQVQTELSLLKSQINPHFFFNTLNNLYALSLDQSERVPGVILKISDLMRYVLESSKQKSVPLADEAHFLENYIELEKLRFSRASEIRMTVNGGLKGRHIAPMLLVPFVENSFKHGLNASVDDGFIHIELTVDAGELDFRIENNKSEHTDVSNASAAMGLENVKRRLELLYPGRHLLSIQDNAGRYLVKLRIQL